VLLKISNIDKKLFFWIFIGFEDEFYND